MPVRTPAKKPPSLVDQVLSPRGIGTLLFIMLILSGGAYLFSRKATYMNRLSMNNAKMTPTPTPTPRPIPHGKIGFGVSGSGVKGPQFGRGYLDPYDPAIGTKQIIRIALSDSQPITSVTGVIKTDNKQQDLTFTFAEGTANNSQWEAAWIVNDTYLYTYEVDILATSPNGSDHVEIMLR